MKKQAKIDERVRKKLEIAEEKRQIELRLKAEEEAEAEEDEEEEEEEEDVGDDLSEGWLCKAVVSYYSYYLIILFSPCHLVPSGCRRPLVTTMTTSRRPLKNYCLICIF